jgi:hypothetical protein
MDIPPVLFLFMKFSKDDLFTSWPINTMMYPKKWQSFSSRDNCDALKEGKRLKGGYRKQKIKLIEEVLPRWRICGANFQRP